MKTPEPRRSARARLKALSDDALVVIARRQLPHTTVAYEILMRRYQDPLMRACHRYLGSAHDAEETVHDVMLKVFYGLPKFKGDSSFKTWLYRIVHNESISMLRKRKEHLSIDDLEEPLLVAKTKNPDEFMMAQSLERWLCALDEQDRSIVVFRGIAELEYQEIADIVGLNLSAVKMRYQRALDKIKIQSEK